jgi:hypothetical protein
LAATTIATGTVGAGRRSRSSGARCISPWYTSNSARTAGAARLTNSRYAAQKASYPARPAPISTKAAISSSAVLVTIGPGSR